MPRPDNKNEKLLTEIREHFTYASEQWRSIREEAKKDMRYISGDPWDPAHKQKRMAKDRPCLTFDELNQYVNQLINDARQNKRSIKVMPMGSGANDKTAEFRQGMIRQIEYKSNAQTAYLTAFENAASRSYGYFRIGVRYVQGLSASFDQELYIGRIPNPDTVFMDPDFKEFDGSDMDWCYVIDNYSKEKYKKKFPGAEIRDFTAEHMDIATQWISDDRVQVGEYWTVEKSKRTLMLFEGDEQATGYEDEFEGGKLESDGLHLPPSSGHPQGKHMKVKNSKREERREICQYLTNGLEILDKTDWRGSWIPIIPVFGKEIYVDSGSGSKRVLMSLIRLARDPQMSLCYLVSQEAEEASMTPKCPTMGYTGQFETDRAAWEALNTDPRAFIQIDAVTDQATGQVLPHPSRPQFVPNFQLYEIAKESTKRAIQSACGMYNTSVGKHDTNVKSGTAIKALDQQSNEGSFHFLDNFERALEHGGRILNEQIKIRYDAEGREVGIREADDEYKTIKLNQPYTDEKGEQQHYDTKVGEHDVTISTGPSYDSQREEAANFIDTLIPNLAELPIDPALKARLLALSIKIKDLGPLGDEMVAAFDPPKQGDPAQMQQQAQQAVAMVQQLQQELAQLQQEKQAKVVEGQMHLEKAKLDNATKLDVERLRIDADVAKAEIATKSQNLSERIKFVEDVYQQLHDSAHELAMQKDQQGHEANQADQAQAHDATQASQAQAHESDQATQAQEAAQQQAEAQPAE
jgi:hypothetical protein